MFWAGGPVTGDGGWTQSAGNVGVGDGLGLGDGVGEGLAVGDGDGESIGSAETDAVGRLQPVTASMTARTRGNMRRTDNSRGGGQGFAEMRASGYAHSRERETPLLASCTWLPDGRARAGDDEHLEGFSTVHASVTVGTSARPTVRSKDVPLCRRRADRSRRPR
jgi:hypothetical protein